MSKQAKPVQAPSGKMFTTWENGDNQAQALAVYEAGQALRKVEPVVRSHGSKLWLNIAPNSVSVRDSFNRDDFDDFRRGDALPTKPKEIIKACMQAYSQVGIIRNIIDLMGDFATQGIDINHPNERIERWYKDWFRRVRGKDRSERFMNLLFRTANVIVQRHTAKLPIRLDKQMRRAKASPDIKIEPGPNVSTREIPWRYTFHNPLSTEVLSNELSLFLGQDNFVYGIKVPQNLAKKIKNPKGDLEKSLVAKIPEKIRNLILKGEQFLTLDPEKVRGYFYKRDDWDVWAQPITYAVLADIQVLQKMKLADLAALDGAISCIRVWKLGSLEHRIMPTQVAIQRLAEMLCNNVGGGVMDLIWGPELELLETKTDVHHFLGDTKYQPVLTAIYAGLGIPPTLTGTPGQSSGFTNNSVSLKTLVERLQYGRDILTEFWTEEIRLVQKAMGFRFPGTLVFDRMQLTDEAAEKQLLINLADRDLISMETLQERLGASPEIERVRIRREERRRKNRQLPPKASPFHMAEKDHEYTKILLNQGHIAPSETGLELQPRKPGEKSLNETKQAYEKKQGQQQQDATPKGQPGQGRPKNKKDSQKRKQKMVNPRASTTFFQVQSWAEQAQEKVGQITAPAYLRSLGKKTLRDLTDEESSKYETLKFHLLCQLQPNQTFDETTIRELCLSELNVPAPMVQLLNATVAEHVRVNGKNPSLEIMRGYQAGVFAVWHAADVSNPNTGES